MRGGVDGRARRGRGEDEAGLGGDLLGDAVLEGEDIGGGPSKDWAQRWRSVRASMSWAVMRMRSPERTMEPSTMASTPSWRAMSGSERREPLSAMTEVRETTRRLGIRASSVMSSSVMPSAKYSWAGSPERFWRGSTAIEPIAARVSRWRKRAASGWGPRVRYRNDYEYGRQQGGDQPKSAAGFNRRRGDGRSRDLRRTRRRLDRSIRRFGGTGDLWLDRSDGCDKPVTGAGNCLHKLRQVGAVAEGLANFTDGRVNSVFDIDEDFPLPQARGDFVTSNNLSMFGDQEDEEFERLPLKLEPAAFAAELKFAAMKAEVAELKDGKGTGPLPRVAEV